MNTSKIASITTAFTIVAAFTAAELARAGGDKVTFPQDFAKGVAYMSIDRPGGKAISEYYTSREAIEAAKKGMPLPDGTVITAANFPAQPPPQPHPLKHANHPFLH